MVDPVTELGAAADIGKPWDGPMVPDLRPPRHVCTKMGYPTRHEATRVIGIRMNSRHHRPRYLRAYECPRCGQWHLTSKELET